jgi:predicted dehydrogenase
MAVHLADADRMLAAARVAGTLLCINHQRRFAQRYARARRAIDAGTIGPVRHITAICGGDLLTDGTHLIDLTRFLVNDAPIEWVFGGIDRSRRPTVNLDGPGFAQWLETGLRYGHHVEGGVLAALHFAGGVRATLEIGTTARRGYQKFVVDGAAGRIEISGDRPDEDEPELRIIRAHGRSTVVDRFPPHPRAGVNAPMAANVAAMVACLRHGGAHPLRGESARATLEAIMAIFASAIDRRRVDLPFDQPESPFETMIERGEFVLL